MDNERTDRRRDHSDRGTLGQGFDGGRACARGEDQVRARPGAALGPGRSTGRHAVWVVVGIALATAATLVVGAAASLSVTSPGLGANAVVVGDCDTDGVPVSSFEIVYDTADDRYEVADVTVKNLDAACSGATLAVTLTDVSNASLGSGTTTVSATTATVTMSPAPASANVTSVHISLVGP